MHVQPAAFLRTTLPVDFSNLKELDGGRYHSIWLPDHMVSFWPDSIWTPEFTDLATVSKSRRTATWTASRWRPPWRPSPSGCRSP